MNLILTALNGATEGTAITLAVGDCVTFGRTSASHRSFPHDTHMSSVHFEIEHFGSWAEIRDKRSTNGTWLNSNRITVERLSEGDQVRAGTTLFSVQFRNLNQAPRSLPPGFQDSTAEPPIHRNDSQREPITFAPLEPRETDFRSPNPITGWDQKAGNAPGSNLSGIGQLPSDYSAASVFPETGGTGNRDSLVPSGDTRGNPIGNVHPRPNKNLNPFGDSVDFSELPMAEVGASSMTRAPMELPVQEDFVKSPICDSSIIVPSDFELTPQRAETILQHDFLSRRLSTSLGDGVNTIVEVLSREYSIQVVFHPQKIRQVIPDTCEPSQQLWSCYGNDNRFGPITIPWLNFKQQWHPFLERLCSSDAIVFFLGDNLQKIQRRLRELSMAEVPGFSEAGGFLNCFWPSSLLVILSSRGKRGCHELFDGKIDGLLMPSPLETQIVLAAANARLATKLRQVDFQSSNLLGG